MGFGCALPFLAGVRGACEWVWVFRAPCYFWLGCWGVCPVARASSVFLHPLFGLPVAWVYMGVAVGGAPAPPLFCFSLLGCGAGSVGVVLGPVVLWVCGGRRRLSQSWAPWLLPPLPLPFGSRLFFFSVWPVARILSGGLCPGVSGVSFPPALRRPCGYRGLLLLAGRRQAGRCGPPVFYRGASWLSPLVLHEGQFACFLWSGYADLRLCVCPRRFPSFPLTGGCAFLVGWGLPPSVFYSLGGIACSSLCLPWAGARTGRHLVWLTGSLLVMWVAAGRTPALWVWWVRYTLGLVACPIGLGAASAGWAVAAAGCVRSWVRAGGVARVPPPLRCRFGGGGFNLLVAVCAGGLQLSGGGGLY